MNPENWRTSKPNKLVTGELNKPAKPVIGELDELATGKPNKSELTNPTNWNIHGIRKNPGVQVNSPPVAVLYCSGFPYGTQIDIRPTCTNKYFSGFSKLARKKICKVYFSQETRKKPRKANFAISTQVATVYCSHLVST